MTPGDDMPALDGNTFFSDDVPDAASFDPRDEAGQDDDEDDEDTP